MPGVSAERLVAFKRLFRGYAEEWLSGGKQIDGTYSRDPTNTGNLDVLLPGVVMGKRTSGGLYAPSIIGLTNGALASGGTTLTATAATITEIIRRIGTTGSLKITGPPSASGVVGTSTVTFSSPSGTTATIAGLGTNEVQRVDFNIASSGGSVALLVPKTDGSMVLTTGASWSGTDATYLAAINVVLDAATGVSGGIVATAISAVDTDLGFKLTYSGTGYAGLPQPMASVTTLPTSSTSWSVSRTTTGAQGAFVTQSLIQPTDGSETPLTFIGEADGGIQVTDVNGGNIVVPFHRLPVAGEVDAAQLVNWPADASLRLWLMAALSTASGGKFVFSEKY